MTGPGLPRIEAKALALCLARMAGADLYSPYTREHSDLCPVWLMYEGIATGLSVLAVLEFMREGLDPEHAVLYSHPLGPGIEHRLGSARVAAARILSVQGLVIPEFLGDCREWVGYLGGK